VSSVVGWALVLLLAADGTARRADAAPDTTSPQAASGAEATPAASPEATPPRRGRERSERSVGNELPLAPRAGEQAPGQSWRPALLVPRNPTVAAALGGLVGFGSGLHYAGEPVQGVAFGVADGALVTGLVALELVLNRDVLQRDFEVGRSLGRGQRSMTSHEKTLYAGAWVTGGLLVASHVVQAVLGLQAARRYDATLEQVSCVPLAGEAGLR
jgi:hypothetical protein